MAYNNSQVVRGCVSADDSIFIYGTTNRTKRIWTEYLASPDLEQSLTKTKKQLRQAANRVWALRFFPLLCYYATLTAAATKTKPIGDDDDRRFTIIVNSASTAAPIGLPPKMAKYCHTSNRSLLGRQCRRALLRLYFNSSATGRRLVVGWWLVVGRWSVGNNGYRALGGSLQKDKMIDQRYYWTKLDNI